MKPAPKMTTPTLRDMAPGSDARVKGFSAGLRPEVSRRLRELGFGQGDLVRCLRVAPLGGPRVYAVSGAAFALEAELAEQVQVSWLEPHGDR
ncbi:MAG: FeoA family protein [Myxococcaceae bacterium]